MNAFMLSLIYGAVDPLLLGIYATLLLSILLSQTYLDLCHKDKVTRLHDRAKALLPVKEYILQPAGEVIDSTDMSESIPVDQII